MAGTRVIFGTGICLQNNWKLIEKYFAPEYLTDNNAEKWNTYPFNEELKCISPELLCQLPEPQVLISVGDPYAIAKIEEQLDKMGVSHIDIYEFINQWGDKEELPVHLETIKKNKGKKRFIVFNSPEHDNIGDHLISIAELRFFQKYFPETEVIEITDIEYMWHHNTIKDYVTHQDIIIVTGGGFLGSLWLYNGESNVRRVIEEYPDNRIIIMPQTIFFEENERGMKEEQKTKEIYNNHKNLTICLRELVSYKRMNLLMDEHVKVELVPDMVLSLNYSDDNIERKGVLSCLRKDKESILSVSGKEKIKQTLKSLTIDYSETSMHSGNCVAIEGREEECKNKIAQIKNKELVITDTLHCMIVCAITGTPCIAINNISKKVQNVYEWISYLPYVVFLEELDSLDKAIEKLKGMKGQNYDNSCLQGQYEKLAQIIGEGINYG